MDYPWGPFQPDIAGPNSGVAEAAIGVLARRGPAKSIAYGPASQFVTQPGAGALPAAPRGSISLQLQDESWATFIATAATIQQLQSDYTFSAIETGRTVTTGNDVSFAHFGKYLLNTDTTDGLKAYDVEAGGSNTAVSGAIAARSCYVSNNVVFLLGTSSNDKAWKSSGIGDHTTYTTSGANGGVYTDGGALICGRDLGNGFSVQFQDSAMRLIQFTGAAPTGALFVISKVPNGRGALSDRSVVAADGAVYWPSKDDFWRFDPSIGVVSIGQDKIRDWFFGSKDGTGGVADLSALATIEGAYDARRKCIFWAYKSLGNTSNTVFTDILIYSLGTGEFTTARVTTTLLTQLATSGVVADDLDSYGPADSVDIAMDDPLWQGTAPFLAGLDADYKFASFSGAPQAAMLRGCKINSPVTGLIGRASPISDCATSTLKLGVADSPDAAIAFKPPAARGRAGRVPLRGRGLNIQFEENFPAGAPWTFANGVDHIESAARGPT